MAGLAAGRGLTGGGGWIRTNVGARQRIYSPSPLATRAPLLRRKASDIALTTAGSQRRSPLTRNRFAVPLQRPINLPGPRSSNPPLPQQGWASPPPPAIPRWLPSFLGLFIAFRPTATDMYLPAFPQWKQASAPRPAPRNSRLRRFPLGHPPRNPADRAPRAPHRAGEGRALLAHRAGTDICDARSYGQLQHVLHVRLSRGLLTRL
jgi:hypothetical protein